MEFTAELPADPEAERAIVGCMLLNPESIPDLIEGLGTDGAPFNGAVTSILYKALIDLNDRNVQADQHMLSTYLRNQASALPGMSLLDVVGPETLNELFQAQYNPANLEPYVEQVQRLHLRRQLIRVAGELARMGYANSNLGVPELMSKAEHLVYSIRSMDQQSGLITAEQAVRSTWAIMEKQIADPNYYRGIKTGITNLDRILDAVDPGRLFILAGRPGFGKTTTALHIAHDLVLHQKEPVLFVAYEQNEIDHTHTMLSIHTRVSKSKIQHAARLEGYDMDDIQHGIDALSRPPIFYANMGDPVHVKSLARRASAMARDKFGKPLALVVVDYLGLIPRMPNSRANTKDQEMGEITKYFKLMARELNCVVMVLAQLNRESERRGDHRPVLSDLRESGNIEQDADIVVFTYCPTFYMDDRQRRQVLSNYEEGYEPQDLIVAKWRAGRTGTAKCAWNKDKVDIRSMEET